MRITSRSLMFSLRGLRREWRAGELRVLLLALAVAVAAVTAVGFFTDRVHKAMLAQGSELLAADLVVAGKRPPDPSWVQHARELGLAVAHTESFRSVVMGPQGIQLAEVKAVGAGYPLRGHLEVADVPFGAGRIRHGGPPAGEVWAEGSLLQKLSLKVGQELGLGALHPTLGAVLVNEPDRGGDLFSIAPRLLMNLEDLAATQLVQTGSLVTYRLLLAGEPTAVAQMRRWLEPRLGDGQRLQGLRDARPELRSALDRAERFLGLASLVSVLLAGVAVAMAARRYARRHLDGVAVMRCLGAQQGFVSAAFLWQLLWLGLLGALLGAALGFMAQQVLVEVLGGMFSQRMPAPSLVPLWQGALVALVTLTGFALPPLLALRGVPPLRVLRRELGPLPTSGVLVYGAALGALLALMAWQAQDLRLALLVFAGVGASLAFLALGARLALLALGRVRRGVGVAWRFGLANMVRHPQTSVAQVLAFGLGIMVLLLLSLVRNDLLAGWRDSLPADAPNQFLINVLPDQVQPLRRFLSERGFNDVGLHPMVRGRLVSINQQPVSAEDYEEPRARRLVQRAFNLSWSEQRPEHNRLSAGRWWQPGAAEQWSVEQGLAKTLGIALGDHLVFDIGGERRAGVVSSLREVRWDSFKVNFFVLAPPATLQGFPASYITSFYVAPRQRQVLTTLVQRFPNVTVVDVDAIMSRVRQVIERVTLAVQFVFGFTLLAGLMVLYAAIQSTHDERLREAALLRTLGARHRQVLAGLFSEFVTLGALAGLLGAAAASALGAVLAWRVFDLDYGFDPWLWLAGLLGGALGVGVAGLLGTRSVLREPPLWSLRRL